jgi:signal transduction histidine kinase
LHHQNLAPGLFWRVNVIQALMWVAVGLGLISLGIAAVLRQTPTYFWFGLCCLAYAVSCVNELWVNFPKDPRLLSWVIFSSRMVTVPLLILTFLTVVPDRLRWLKKTLVLFAVMAPVLIGLSENSRTVVMMLYVPLMGMSIVVTGYLLHTRWRTGSMRALLAGLGLMVFVAVGLVDWMRLSGQTDFEGVLLGSYAFGGLLLAVGGLLSLTLADALRISRTFNERLEGEVQKRTLQIEQLNRELTLLEVERTRVQVREKLIQDMHDGFGSQLATASIMAKNNELSPPEMGQLLDDCLTDLQLVVDTHLASSHNLCDVLFDFKHRLLQRLGNTQLQLQFDIDVPEGAWLSQDKTLQFLRVLQEAVSNALRHAGAQRLQIGVLLKPQEHKLEAFVRDDGQGLNPARKAGRGLNTMKARVRELGGEIKLLSQQGLSVDIWVPTHIGEPSAGA